MPSTGGALAPEDEHVRDGARHGRVAGLQPALHDARGLGLQRAQHVPRFSPCRYTPIGRGGDMYARASAMRSGYVTCGVPHVSPGSAEGLHALMTPDATHVFKSGSFTSLEGS